MEIQMQIIQPMATVSVGGGGIAKSNAAPTNSSFGALLMQMMGGNTGEQAQGLLPIAALPSTPSLTANIQPSSGNSEVDVEALIKLVQSILDSDTASQIAENPELHSLLTQLLQWLQTSVPDITDSAELGSTAGSIRNAGYPSQLVSVLPVLREVMEEVEAQLHDQRGPSVGQQITTQAVSILKIAMELANSPTSPSSTSGKWSMVSAEGKQSGLSNKVLTQDLLKFHTFHQNHAVEVHESAASQEASAIDTDTATGEAMVAVKNGTLPVKSETIPVPIQRFTGEMSQLVLRTVKHSGGEMLTEAKIHLFPERLGQVEVKLSLQNGQLVAQFLTETALGKDAIESQLSQLRANLQSQGINVDKLEVSQNLTQMTQHQFQDQRNQSPLRQFHLTGKTKSGSYEETLERIDDLSNDNRAASTLGSSFEATA